MMAQWLSQRFVRRVEEEDVKLLEDEQPSIVVYDDLRRPSGSNYGTISKASLLLVVAMVGTLAEAQTNGTVLEGLPDLPGETPPGAGHEEKETLVIGQMFAWISLFCYITSRLPQIYKNFSRRSVEGLSIYLFAFAALGNTCYTLGIFLKSTDWTFIAKTLPYLLGSGGTLIFDVIIFTQYLYYTAEVKYELVQDGASARSRSSSSTNQ
jgi:uncharacterized protein with PQ loop repeat